MLAGFFFISDIKAKPSQLMVLSFVRLFKLIPPKGIKLLLFFNKLLNFTTPRKEEFLL